MPKQEEVTEELQKMQQRVQESQKTEQQKKEHGGKRVLRLVLMYGALALIVAVVVMAFLNHR